MTRELTTTQPGSLVLAGQAANAVARRHVLADYLARLSRNTRDRQADTLATFETFLRGSGVEGAVDLAGDLEAWRGITWGLVETFKRWLVVEGYAIGSINVMLSTLRVYAGLAGKAGVLDAGEVNAIRAVQGYTLADGRNLDKARGQSRRSRVTTRRAGVVRTVERTKKGQAVVLSDDDARRLRTQSNTPRGRRDALLVGLLLDLGLRVGEVVALRVGDVDLKAGLLRVERPKVGLVGERAQRHRMRNGLLRAMRAYMIHDAPAMAGEPLLRAAIKGDKLAGAGLTRESAARIVHALGEAIGVDGLSPHDLRHAWATRAARNDTDVFALMDGGGWASPAMPARYVERAKIANERVRLGDDDD